jgi:hypothetical protein
MVFSDIIYVYVKSNLTHTKRILCKKTQVLVFQYGNDLDFKCQTCMSETKHRYLRQYNDRPVPG